MRMGEGQPFVRPNVVFLRERFKVLQALPVHQSSCGSQGRLIPWMASFWRMLRTFTCNRRGNCQVHRVQGRYRCSPRSAKPDWVHHPRPLLTPWLRRHRASSMATPHPSSTVGPLQVPTNPTRPWRGAVRKHRSHHGQMGQKRWGLHRGIRTSEAELRPARPACSRMPPR